MASRQTNAPKLAVTKRRPATTPEARENQLIALAVDLAERQLIDGTASAQVTTFYIKLGSSREKLEQERLLLENDLLVIKAEAFASAARVEEMYKSALDAMRSYAGHEPIEMQDEFDD
jgi:hypothetical protein